MLYSIFNGKHVVLFRTSFFLKSFGKPQCLIAFNQENEVHLLNLLINQILTNILEQLRFLILKPSWICDVKKKKLLFDPDYFMKEKYQNDKKFSVKESIKEKGR